MSPIDVFVSLFDLTFLYTLSAPRLSYSRVIHHVTYTRSAFYAAAGNEIIPSALHVLLFLPFPIRSETNNSFFSLLPPPHHLRASETRTGAYISTDSFFFFFLPSSQINILNISRGSIVYVCYIICVPLVRRPFLSFDSRLLLPAPRLCEHHGSEKSIRRAAITTESPQTTSRANPLI